MLLIGAGNLGRALGYKGFEQHGIRIVAGFDTNPAIIGKTIAGKNIHDINENAKANTYKLNTDRFTTICTRNCGCNVPSWYSSDWNFTPVTLNVPDYVILQREELASSLAVISPTYNRTINFNI